MITIYGTNYQTLYKDNIENFGIFSHVYKMFKPELECGIDVEVKVDSESYTEVVYISEMYINGFKMDNRYCQERIDIYKQDYPNSADYVEFDYLTA